MCEEKGGVLRQVQHLPGVLLQGRQNASHQQTDEFGEKKWSTSVKMIKLTVLIFTNNSGIRIMPICNLNPVIPLNKFPSLHETDYLILRISVSVTESLLKHEISSFFPFPGTIFLTGSGSADPFKSGSIRALLRIRWTSLLSLKIYVFTSIMLHSATPALALTAFSNGVPPWPEHRE
jgi:hypothetical protein